MMTKAEYRAAIAALGMRQGDVGDLMGVDRRTSRRWANGEVAVPRPVELHLRLLLERPELLPVVRRISGAALGGVDGGDAQQTANASQ